MKFIVWGSLFCAIFAITTTHAMDESEDLVEVIIDKQDQTTPLMPGDHVVLKKVKKPKMEIPPMSLGNKIISGLCTAGCCIGTTAGAALGEWGIIKYLHDSSMDESDPTGIPWIGTAVGMGICTLGLLGYACGAGSVKYYRANKAKKDKQKITFEIEDTGSVV